MRIIVTQNGDNFIQSLNQEKVTEDTNKNKENLKTSSKADLTIESNDKNNEVSKIIQNMKNSKNLKLIEIKPKKLSIPKNIAEKYNEIKLEEPSLLPVLYRNIPKIKENPKLQLNTLNKSHEEIDQHSPTKENNINSTEENLKNPYSINYNNSNFIKTSYKMKEIINDSALKNIKYSIISDVKMKNKLSNVVTNNFRTPFLTPDEKLSDIEFALDKKIKSDKANIIQYLNSKLCLSPKFVKSLSNYDEEKFVRLNKICQRVFNQDGKDFDLKTKIDSTIDNMKIFQKSEYKRKMNQMEKEVNTIKNIIEKYPMKNNREKYENLLHDIKKKYWDKISVDKPAKRDIKTETNH